jgi:hypothetical protein
VSPKAGRCMLATTQIPKHESCQLTKQALPPKYANYEQYACVWRMSLKRYQHASRTLKNLHICRIQLLTSKIHDLQMFNMKRGVTLRSRTSKHIGVHSYTVTLRSRTSKHIGVHKYTVQGRKICHSESFGTDGAKIFYLAF